METPKFRFGPDLREIPEDPSALTAYIAHLRDRVHEAADPITKATVLGELGAYLRVHGQLDKAETSLREALALGAAIGPAFDVRQKLRLAHVLQWKRQFSESTKMFASLIARCLQEEALKPYLPFAWQHAGKNYFDQNMLEDALQAFESALALRRENGAPKDQIESSQQAVDLTKARLGRP